MFSEPANTSVIQYLTSQPINTEEALSNVKFRLTRWNVFPLLLLLILMFLKQLIAELRLLLPWDKFIVRVSNNIFEYCCHRNDTSLSSLRQNKELKSYNLQQSKNPLRREVAPFTGEYFKYVDNASNIILANNKKKILLENEKKSNCMQSCTNSICKAIQGFDDSDPNDLKGWLLMDMDGRKAKMKPLVPSLDNNNSSKFHYIGRSMSEDSGIAFMRTYEVISENGCNSYAIEKIPSYKLAIENLINELKKTECCEEYP